MAHDLNIEIGKAAMMYVGDVPSAWTWYAVNGAP